MFDIGEAVKKIKQDYKMYKSLSRQITKIEAERIKIKSRLEGVYGKARKGRPVGSKNKVKRAKTAKVKTEKKAVSVES